MKSCAIGLLALVLSGELRAQSGDYLVPAFGDTLRGKVQPLTFGSFDQVQIILDGRKRVFNVLEVRTFQCDKIIYKPIKLNNKYWFMQLISSGYLSVYAFRYENTPHFDGRLLVTMDGRSLEVPNIGFKGTMADFLDDCPALSDRIRSSELKKKDFELIVREYNNCRQDNPVAQPAVSPLVDNRSLAALDAMERKATQVSFEGKADALELLADIRQKLGRGEKIPKYQVDVLRSYFESIDSTRNELQSLLSSLGY
jgi:hypothetical protein